MTNAQKSTVSLAGPFTNVAAAVVLLVVTRLLYDPAHLVFWSAIAFMGFLQVTAAVLNLLPTPGLDGWAILEPHLAPETVALGEKIKPWGMLGVILLLQIQRLNAIFFTAVDWLYNRTGAHPLLSSLGYEFFRFWAKPAA
jgi:Zn-dependent protease